MCHAAWIQSIDTFEVLVLPLAPLSFFLELLYILRLLLWTHSLFPSWNLKQFTFSTVVEQLVPACVHSMPPPGGDEGVNCQIHHYFVPNKTKFILICQKIKITSAIRSATCLISQMRQYALKRKKALPSCDRDNVLSVLTLQGASRSWFSLRFTTSHKEKIQNESW